MKIGLVSPSWPLGTAANGIVTYVGNLANGLAARGHDVTIITPKGIYKFGSNEPIFAPSMSLVSKIRRRATNYLDSYHGHFPNFGRWYAEEVKKVLKDLQLDIVEMEESFGWSLIFKNVLDIPIVTRLHGPHFLQKMYFKEFGTGIDEGRIRAERSAICQSLALSCPSKTLLELCEKELSISNSSNSVIPNPIDDVTPDSLWESGNSSEVLFVGRVDYAKGADVCLKAFELALRENSNLTLTMIGPDNGIKVNETESFFFIDHCSKFLSKTTISKIQFLGKLPPSEINHYRRRAGLTVVASRLENFPYAVLEAMILGCPIIASNSFGIGEMIEDGKSGNLFEPGDSLALSNKLLECVSDDERTKQMGIQARLNCLERYWTPKIANSTEIFFSKVLNAPRSR